MKKLTITTLLVLLLSGCFFNNDTNSSIASIQTCVKTNSSNMNLDEVIDECKKLCQDNSACERRVGIITQEEFNPTKIAKKQKTKKIVVSKKQEEDTEIESQLIDHSKELLEADNSTTKTTIPISQEQIDAKTEDKTDSQFATLSGNACTNKENLPKMKVFIERIEVRDWYWIVPVGGTWEYDEIKPGTYKVYFAPDRNSSPLAKYSNSIADNVDNHDYKILNLEAGDVISGINPCDWE